MKTTKQITDRKLKALEAEYNDRLVDYVISDLFPLNTDERLFYIKEVLQNGCQSGIVGSLIYYTDTHKFFNEFSDEIFEILEEIKDNTGEEFSNYSGDRKNTLAWLGYEETMRKIADSLNLDI